MAAHEGQSIFVIMGLHKWAFGKIPYEYEDDSEREGLGLYDIEVHVKNGQLDMSSHEPLFIHHLAIGASPGTRSG